jgi:hypothetical protein
MNGTSIATGFVGSGAPGSGGPGTGGGNCGGELIQAEQVPLDMFIMLDKSGSMGDDTGAGTKWQVVTSALITFVQDGTSAGIGVGIQYFPIPPVGGTACPGACNTAQEMADCNACAGLCFFGLCAGSGANDSCNAVDYAQAAVPIGLLPGNAPALVASINSNGPNGGTPTSAALQGAIDHCRAWATANPTHAVIQVHVTDGNPQECNTDLNAIYAIAAAGFNGTPSILTYVIGVGPSLNALQGIALAGGSGTPFLVDSNPNAGQAFLDAMNAIRGTALTCTYTIPTPTQGPFDPNFVNVQYTPGNGGPTQTIGKVANQAACPPGGMAWYYDNNANPMLIHLCPDTCGIVSVDTMGSINISLGCETIPF